MSENLTNGAAIFKCCEIGIFWKYCGPRIRNVVASEKAAFFGKRTSHFSTLRKGNDHIKGKGQPQ